MPQRNALGGSACVCQSRKGEQKGKAVLINEDTVHSADGNGTGDAKVARKRLVRRPKSESANAVLRTKRMKDPSRNKKGARVEETVPSGSLTSPSAFGLFSPRSWVNRRSCPPLRRALQRLRKLVPQVHRRGVGI